MLNIWDPQTKSDESLKSVLSSLKILSRGGRLQLVKSVLSSLHIYHMSCFNLPQWVLKRIDKIRREFMWGRSSGDKSSFSWINWISVCMPTGYGGMGVAFMQLRNIVMVFRLWWKLYEHANLLWADMVHALKRLGGVTDGPAFGFLTDPFSEKTSNH